MAGWLVAVLGQCNVGRSYSLQQIPNLFFLALIFQPISSHCHLYLVWMNEHSCRRNVPLFGAKLSHAHHGDPDKIWTRQWITHETTVVLSIGRAVWPMSTWLAYVHHLEGVSWPSFSTSTHCYGADFAPSAQRALDAGLPYPHGFHRVLPLLVYHGIARKAAWCADLPLLLLSWAYPNGPCPSRRMFHGTCEPIYSGSPLKREIDWLHPSDFSQLPANLSHVPVQDLISCITSLWQALMRQISVTDFVYCKWTPPMFVSIVQPCVTPKQSNEHPCVSLLCSHVS